ncbi:tolloid-like protein 2 [Ostrea edulis]|uniref:tolloid-like protein 2 n=1 Tax=Ostrea edulis TaxID=37623 RepID=UPI0024AEEEF0|nr:tolloid-like protein 2 [Ostrea edulis]XP_056007356.1 tolloid-like protein 2 [Ostrea edulis]XP_056007357.1 tolloid-like protein 2 [Ostrea edulis]XP_056007358.1 tolloid-like protein 2 [Ostrea edulis]XP_056007359.1 tolloid-like protein 2 [Ostrea edulis]XP_056007360.1 tolloid-like protein 2 [Ostrea edulis]
MGVGLKLIVLLLAVQKGFCQTCNTNIVASQSEMTSLTTPGYNGGTGSYTSNLDCYWVLDAGADDMRILMFVTYDISCPNDKFYIHDGPNGTYPKTADGLCGKAVATHYSTSQRYAYVRMTSDASVELAGLLVEYVAAKDYSGSGCGGKQVLTATDTSQYLSSPSFPSQYPSDSNCRWTINNYFGTVELQVLMSDIEAGNPASCNYDHYEIYDGEYMCEHNTIHKVCQEYEDVPAYNYTSNGTSLVVKFFSDGSVNRRGFFMKYRAITASTTIASTTIADTTTEEATTESTTTETTTLTTISTATSTSSTTQSTTSSSPCTTKATTYITTTKAEGLTINFELLLGFIGGSLFLICLTVVIVVCVVTKAKPPSGKTITPVQPFRPYETVNKNSIRIRKASKIPKQISSQSGVVQKVPPW